ncbi:hypothetical protein GQX74_006805 [Glossina fuscipes]|nr:hypothetical protein GQX74_006805 [Glossina fuscipes]
MSTPWSPVNAEYIPFPYQTQDVQSDEYLSQSIEALRDDEGDQRFEGNADFYPPLPENLPIEYLEQTVAPDFQDIPANASFEELVCILASPPPPRPQIEPQFVRPNLEQLEASFRSEAVTRPPTPKEAPCPMALGEDPYYIPPPPKDKTDVQGMIKRARAIERLRKIREEEAAKVNARSRKQLGQPPRASAPASRARGAPSKPGGQLPRAGRPPPPGPGRAPPRVSGPAQRARGPPVKPAAKVSASTSRTGVQQAKPSGAADKTRAQSRKTSAPPPKTRGPPPKAGPPKPGGPPRTSAPAPRVGSLPAKTRGQPPKAEPIKPGVPRRASSQASRAGPPAPKIRGPPLKVAPGGQRRPTAPVSRGGPAPPKAHGVPPKPAKPRAEAPLPRRRPGPETGAIPKRFAPEKQTADRRHGEKKKGARPKTKPQDTRYVEALPPAKLPTPTKPKTPSPPPGPTYESIVHRISAIRAKNLPLQECVAEMAGMARELDVLEEATAEEEAAAQADAVAMQAACERMWTSPKGRPWKSRPKFRRDLLDISADDLPPEPAEEGIDEFLALEEAVYGDEKFVAPEYITQLEMPYMPELVEQIRQLGMYGVPATPSQECPVSPLAQMEGATVEAIGVEELAMMEALALDQGLSGEIASESPVYEMHPVLKYADYKFRQEQMAEAAAAAAIGAAATDVELEDEECTPPALAEELQRLQAVADWELAQMKTPPQLQPREIEYLDDAFFQDIACPEFDIKDVSEFAFSDEALVGAGFGEYEIEELDEEEWLIPEESGEAADVAEEPECPAEREEPLWEANALDVEFGARYISSALVGAGFDEGLQITDISVPSYYEENISIDEEGLEDVTSPEIADLSMCPVETTDEEEPICEPVEETPKRSFLASVVETVVDKVKNIFGKSPRIEEIEEEDQPQCISLDSSLPNMFSIPAAVEPETVEEPVCPVMEQVQVQPSKPKSPPKPKKETPIKIPPPPKDPKDRKAFVARAQAIQKLKERQLAAAGLLPPPPKPKKKGRIPISRWVEKPKPQMKRKKVLMRKKGYKTPPPPVEGEYDEPPPFPPGHYEAVARARALQQLRRKRPGLSVKEADKIIAAQRVRREAAEAEAARFAALPEHEKIKERMERVRKAPRKRRRKVPLDVIAAISALKESAASQSCPPSPRMVSPTQGRISQEPREEEFIEFSPLRAQERMRRLQYAREQAAARQLDQVCPEMEPEAPLEFSPVRLESPKTEEIRTERVTKQVGTYGGEELTKQTVIETSTVQNGDVHSTSTKITTKIDEFGNTTCHVEEGTCSTDKETVMEDLEAIEEPDFLDTSNIQPPLDTSVPTPSELIELIRSKVQEKLNIAISSAIEPVEVSRISPARPQEPMQILEDLPEEDLLDVSSPDVELSPTEREPPAARQPLLDTSLPKIFVEPQPTPPRRPPSPVRARSPPRAPVQAPPAQREVLPDSQVPSPIVIPPPPKDPKDYRAFVARAVAIQKLKEREMAEAARAPPPKPKKKTRVPISKWVEKPKPKAKRKKIVMRKKGYKTPPPPVEGEYDEPPPFPPGHCEAVVRARALQQLRRKRPDLSLKEADKIIAAQRAQREAAEAEAARFAALPEYEKIKERMERVRKAPRRRRRKVPLDIIAAISAIKELMPSEPCPPAVAPTQRATSPQREASHTRKSPVQGPLPERPEETPRARPIVARRKARGRIILPSEERRQREEQETYDMQKRMQKLQQDLEAPPKWRPTSRHRVSRRKPPGESPFHKKFPRVFAIARKKRSRPLDVLDVLREEEEREDSFEGEDELDEFEALERQIRAAAVLGVAEEEASIEATSEEEEQAAGMVEPSVPSFQPRYSSYPEWLVKHYQEEVEEFAYPSEDVEASAMLMLDEATGPIDRFRRIRQMHVSASATTSETSVEPSISVDVSYSAITLTSPTEQPAQTPLAEAVEDQPIDQTLVDIEAPPTHVARQLADLEDLPFDDLEYEEVPDMPDVPLDVPITPPPKPEAIIRRIRAQVEQMLTEQVVRRSPVATPPMRPIPEDLPEEDLLDVSAVSEEEIPTASPVVSQDMLDISLITIFEEPRLPTPPQRILSPARARSPPSALPAPAEVCPPAQAPSQPQRPSPIIIPPPPKDPKDYRAFVARAVAIQKLKEREMAEAARAPPPKPKKKTRVPISRWVEKPKPKAKRKKIVMRKKGYKTPPPPVEGEYDEPPPFPPGYLEQIARARELRELRKKRPNLTLRELDHIIAVRKANREAAEAVKRAKREAAEAEAARFAALPEYEKIHERMSRLRTKVGPRRKRRKPLQVSPSILGILEAIKASMPPSCPPSPQRVGAVVTRIEAAADYEEIEEGEEGAVAKKSEISLQEFLAMEDVVYQGRVPEFPGYQQQIDMSSMPEVVAQLGELGLQDQGPPLPPEGEQIDVRGVCPPTSEVQPSAHERYRRILERRNVPMTPEAPPSPVEQQPIEYSPIRMSSPTPTTAQKQTTQVTELGDNKIVEQVIETCQIRHGEVQQVVTQVTTTSDLYGNVTCQINQNKEISAQDPTFSEDVFATEEPDFADVSMDQIEERPRPAEIIEKIRMEVREGLRPEGRPEPPIGRLVEIETPPRALPIPEGIPEEQLVELICPLIAQTPPRSSPKTPPRQVSPVRSLDVSLAEIFAPTPPPPTPPLPPTPDYRRRLSSPPGPIVIPPPPKDPTDYKAICRRARKIMEFKAQEEAKAKAEAEAAAAAAAAVAAAAAAAAAEEAKKPKKRVPISKWTAPPQATRPRKELKRKRMIIPKKRAAKLPPPAKVSPREAAKRKEAEEIAKRKEAEEAAAAAEAARIAALPPPPPLPLSYTTIMARLQGLRERHGGEVPSVSVTAETKAYLHALKNWLPLPCPPGEGQVLPPPRLTPTAADRYRVLRARTPGLLPKSSLDLPPSARYKKLLERREQEPATPQPCPASPVETQEVEVHYRAIPLEPLPEERPEFAIEIDEADELEGVEEPSLLQEVCEIIHGSPQTPVQSPSRIISRIQEQVRTQRAAAAAAAEARPRISPPQIDFPVNLPDEDLLGYEAPMFEITPPRTASPIRSPDISLPRLFETTPTRARTPSPRRSAAVAPQPETQAAICPQPALVCPPRKVPTPPVVVPPPPKDPKDRAAFVRRAQAIQKLQQQQTAKKVAEHSKQPEPKGRVPISRRPGGPPPVRRGVAKPRGPPPSKKVCPPSKKSDLAPKKGAPPPKKGGPPPRKGGPPPRKGGPPSRKDGVPPKRGVPGPSRKAPGAAPLPKEYVDAVMRARKLAGIKPRSPTPPPAKPATPPRPPTPPRGSPTYEQLMARAAALTAGRPSRPSPQIKIPEVIGGREQTLMQYRINQQQREERLRHLRELQEQREQQGQVEIDFGEATPSRPVLERLEAIRERQSIGVAAATYSPVQTPPTPELEYQFCPYIYESSPREYGEPIELIQMPELPEDYLTPQRQYESDECLAEVSSINQEILAARKKIIQAPQGRRVRRSIRERYGRSLIATPPASRRRLDFTPLKTPLSPESVALAEYERMEGRTSALPARVTPEEAQHYPIDREIQLLQRRLFSSPPEAAAEDLSQPISLLSPEAAAQVPLEPISLLTPEAAAQVPPQPISLLTPENMQRIEENIESIKDQLAALPPQQIITTSVTPEEIQRYRMRLEVERLQSQLAASPSPPRVSPGLTSEDIRRCRIEEELQSLQDQLNTPPLSPFSPREEEQVRKSPPRQLSPQEEVFPEGRAAPFLKKFPSVLSASSRSLEIMETLVEVLTPEEQPPVYGPSLPTGKLRQPKRAGQKIKPPSEQQKAKALAEIPRKPTKSQVLPRPTRQLPKRPKPQTTSLPSMPAQAEARTRSRIAQVRPGARQQPQTSTRPPQQVPTRTQSLLAKRPPQQVPARAKPQVPKRPPQQVPTRAQPQVPKRPPQQVPARAQPQVSKRPPQQIPTRAQPKASKRPPQEIPTRAQPQAPRRLPAQVPTRLQPKATERPQAKVLTRTQTKVPTYSNAQAAVQPQATRSVPQIATRIPTGSRIAKPPKPSKMQPPKARSAIAAVQSSAQICPKIDYLRVPSGPKARELPKFPIEESPYESISGLPKVVVSSPTTSSIQAAKEREDAEFQKMQHMAWERITGQMEEAEKENFVYDEDDLAEDDSFLLMERMLSDSRRIQEQEVDDAEFQEMEKFLGTSPGAQQQPQICPQMDYLQVPGRREPPILPKIPIDAPLLLRSPRVMPHTSNIPQIVVSTPTMSDLQAQQAQQAIQEHSAWVEAMRLGRQTHEEEEDEFAAELENLNEFLGQTEDEFAGELEDLEEILGEPEQDEFAGELENLEEFLEEPEQDELADELQNWEEFLREPEQDEFAAELRNLEEFLEEDQTEEEPDLDNLYEDFEDFNISGMEELGVSRIEDFEEMCQ